MSLLGRDWVLADPIRAYLAANGLVYIAIGITWVSMPSKGRELGISWFPGLTDWLVGALWLLGGGIAVVTGLWGRHRRWGFAGLQSMAFFLSMVFLVSTIIGFVPDDVLPGGRPRSIVTTISYLGFWASAVIVAQIKPQPVIVPPALEEGVAQRHDT